MDDSRINLIKREEIKTRERSSTLDMKKPINMTKMMGQEMIQLQDEVEDLQEQLETALQTGKALALQNKKLKKKKKRMKTQLEEILKEKESWMTIRNLNDTIEDQLRDEKSKAHSLEIELQKMRLDQGEIDERLKKQKQLLENNSKLRAQIKRKTEEIQELRDSREMFERKKQEYEHLINSQEYSDMQDILKDNRRYIDMVKQLEMEVNSLKTERDKNEVEGSMSTVELRRENQDLKKKLVMSANHQRILEQQLDVFQPDRIREKLRDAMAIVEMLKDSHFIMSQTQEELDDMKSQIEQCQNNCLDQIDVVIEEKDEELKGLNDLLAQDKDGLRKQIGKLESENEELSRALNMSKKNFEQFKLSQRIRSPKKQRTPKTRRAEMVNVVPQDFTPTTPEFEVTQSSLGDEIEEAEHPLFGDDVPMHEFFRLIGAKFDPWLCCGIEKGVVEESGSCVYCLKIFLLFLVLPTIIVPPVFIFLVSYIGYYFKYDKLSIHENCVRFITHEKIIYSALLTSFLYFPGIIYALIHFWLMIFAHCCCCKFCCVDNGCCGCCKRKSGDIQRRDYVEV